jgi:hypothetical protein
LVNWGLPTNNVGYDNESINNIHIIHVTQNTISASVANVFGVMGQHPINDLVVADVENESPSLINSFSLEQNYPNPFNPTTKIKYTISPAGTQRAVSVQLKVYDLLGNEVAELVNEYKPAGSYEVEFNAVSGKRNLASGIYFYQLKVNDPSTTLGQSFIQTKKMIHLK